MTRERLRANRTLFFALVGAIPITASAAIAGDMVVRVPADHATIQAAVDAAPAGATVLVADGVYTGQGNRDVDPAGKELVIRSENGPATCVIDCRASNLDPHRAFVFRSAHTRATRLEGFTIRGGATAQGAILDVFNGGAVQILGGSPTLANCVFEGNECGCWGGAVYSGHGGSPLIESCLFRENHSGDDGGGLFCWNGAAPVVVSSVFLGNSAAAQGAAIANFGGNLRPLELVHVTMHDNHSPFSSALASWGPTVVDRSILWGNPGPSGQIQGGIHVTVSHSLVQGGYPGAGNFDADPLFAADGYHLTSSSPCVDAGGPPLSAGGLDIDLQPRIFGVGVDLGADEHAGSAGSDR